MKTIIRLVLSAYLMLAFLQGAYAQVRGRDKPIRRQRRERAPRRGGRAAPFSAPKEKDNDLDYQSFYRYVPMDAIEAAIAESAGRERRYREGFNFLDLDYPKGENNPTSYRFDMGPTNAPVKEGWTRITRGDLFTWEKGYGWSVDLPRSDFAYRGAQGLDREKILHYGIVQNQHLRRAFEKRERPIDIPPIRYFGDPSSLYDENIDDMTRDAVLDPESLAFKVALPNGRYMVSMVIGDLQIPRYGIDVYANGYLVASNVFTGRVMFRGFSEPAFPWPVRVSFPADVVRSNLRIALRPNGNLFKERCEVMAETPDYNYSQLPFCFGRLSKFLGKRMSTHGPPTQMALAGITIAPFKNPPLSLYRQKAFLDKAVKDSNALRGVEQFNADNLKGAEASFDRIPDADHILKAYSYMALAGLLEARPDAEQRCIAKAVAVLEKGCAADRGDILAEDLLKLLRYYKRALYLLRHAAEYDLSQVRADIGALLSWVGPYDILYSKKLMHYGRAFASMDPHRWTPSWHIAEEAFLALEDREPGNRFSGYYLYRDMDGWDLEDYQSDVGDAPKWAALVREGYNRLIDQIEWWGKNRQLPDGRLGGGWGDDVEIGLVWELIMLVNPDASPEAMKTVRAIAEGVWWGGEIDRDTGFFDGIADVEHTGEWTGDSQAVMIGIEYGNPIYYERNLKTAKLMRDLWMGVNAAGHRHFKSMVLGNKATGTKYGDVHDAEIDHPLNMRAAWPAFWAWWYSPTDELSRIFTEWAEAWLADTNRSENGKPAGVIPGPIGFHTDTLGGNNAANWRRGSPRTNAYENPTYSNYIVDLFAQMYRCSGDPKWLKPRAATVSRDGKEVAIARGATVARTVADYRIGDKQSLIDKELNLAEAIKRFRDSWPSVTSEVASTDRIAPPGLHEMYRVLLGQNPQGGLNSVPLTLLRTSRNIAFLNLSSSEKGAKALFYSFSDNQEDVHLRLWRLQVGAEHEVTVGIDENDDDQIDQTLKTFKYKHLHRGDAISFSVPSRKTVVVEAKQTKPGEGMPKRVVDLAMASEDIRYLDGELHITVHNIGNKDCGVFKVNVKHGKTLLESYEVDELTAPNDLEPLTATKTIAWQLPAAATVDKPKTITVEIDPDDRHYEITEVNNVVSRAFPYETKTYMIPRVWPSLARKHADKGLAKYKPFPPDFPENLVR